MFEPRRDFTWRFNHAEVTYSNAEPENAIGTFRRRSKRDAIESVCRDCCLIHAVNQRECE